MREKSKKSILFLLIPLIVVGVFSLFNLTSFYKTAEHRVYDLLLHIKPSVPEDKSLLLIDIDDVAISKVGVWPWSRDIMAEGLILLREFNARYAVFDIEYVDKSPLGINSTLLSEEIPEAFAKEFATINQNINDLFDALRKGSISLKYAQGYVKDLTGLTEASKKILLDKVGEIARDNDKFLGQAARFFGQAFLTVTMLEEKDEAVPEELKQYVLEKVPLKKMKVSGTYPYKATDIRPAIRPVIQGAKGAGFPNVVIDEDGVRRRINLIGEYQGRYFPQLAFSPFLDWVGNPEVEIYPNKVVLKGTALPGRQPRDLAIPLAEDGKVLINWPKKTFLGSFRHITYYELVLHRRLEANLLHNLKLMKDAGYLSYYGGTAGLLDPYQYAEGLRQEVLQDGDLAKVDEYCQARATFFEEVGKFLGSGAEQEILRDIDRALGAKDLLGEVRKTYQELKEEVPKVFSASREVYQNLLDARKRLSENVTGAFCIIGQTGTSTTDIGVNPFEKAYMNVGTHASLINTILSGRFLDDLPWWYSVVLALAMSVLVTLVIRNQNPLPSILIGFGFLMVLVAAGAGFFILTGVYLNLLEPSLSVFLTFLVLTLIKFLMTEKERSYIRNAFSHYLSTDVINELLSDPDKLSLGGDKKYLSAMFTDVKGFSTISENLDPTDLVKLLNAYLTEMSNIIMEQRGTIDKYEGDAIISFFGAPVPFQDHAHKACLSAVRMKKMERILNEHFLGEKLSPTPMVTRIGINTGEMVVGNMGTLQKMDYTIMGNSVNLAARLEGVNKQYGTWVLISESTYGEGGADFTVRKLDRVRVVGIQQPVRLYELIDEKNAADAKLVEALEIFHQGLSVFEEKDWTRAQKSFQQVLELLPGDGPADVYLKRCQEYQKKAPPESWDGVFNLTMK